MSRETITLTQKELRISVIVITDFAPYL